MREHTKEGQQGCGVCGAVLSAPDDIFGWE